MPPKAVNSVEVDEAAELAALEAFAARAEADDAADAAAAVELEHEQAGHDPGAWRKATDFVVDVVAGQGCPNWQLETGDREQLSGALAGVLDHYFPGGPNGVDNWHPLYQLAFVAATITLTRGVDWQLGALKPLHPRPKNGTDETPERVASVPSGDDALGKERSGFSVGGG